MVRDIPKTTDAMRMFECPVCDSQYTSRLAAAECCDPAWEDS